MGYINVFLSQPASVSVRNRQLIVKNIDGEHSFIADDINCIMIENLQCTLNAYVLQFLAQNKVAVFLCDERHLPTAVCLPFDGYYRPLPVIRLQTEIPKPLQKNLWQSIVRRKIEGQAKVLEKIGCKESATLYGMAKSVKSDDSGNVEATAAQCYFKHYLQQGRREPSFANSCLNYAYAILRGLCARTLVSNGFEPVLGLHHANTLNRFNLADDIMEPYRPLIDLWVYENAEGEELTPAVKRILFSVVNIETVVDGDRYNLSYAVEMTVQSLRKSLEEGKNLLKLPTFEQAILHYYE